MSRLPTPGGDSGNWGDVLNDFLGQGHDAAGLNVGPIAETLIGSGHTLATTDNGRRLVITAAVTITIPSVGTLGNGFECELINDSGGTVTIDGPGSTDVQLLDGNIACVLEVNGKQRVSMGATVIIS